VLDPKDLYDIEAEAPSAAELTGPNGGPVLVQALGGFVDAGAGVRLTRAHLLSTFHPRPLASFDVDRLLDYRSRRPVMLFDADHWESYDDPTLALHLLHDDAGVPFLLLDGAEPDLHWERFVEAVHQLVDRFGVRLTVGLNAIPMAVPHTRPVGMTAHATRKELVAGYEPWVDQVQVPASAGALLEFRLGQSGRDAVGFAVNVPHYLAQSEYPAAAVALLASISAAGQLSLPSDDLAEAADRVRGEIDKQVEGADEVQAVVRGLEEQYDAYLGNRSKDNLLSGRPGGLPTADELGAELERFLAAQPRPEDPPVL
jgi:hypothetical protein